MGDLWIHYQHQVLQVAQGGLQRVQEASEEVHPYHRLYQGAQGTLCPCRLWLQATACRGTEFPGLLGTAGDRDVLLHLLLGHAANLPGPLGALGVGGVSRGLILALLLNLSGALDDIVLHIVHLLLGPTLGLVLGPADLRSLDITILDKRSPANLSGLVEGNLLVLNETVLPEVLFAVLLLLGLVVGDIGGVAPPVVGVVALDNIVILDLLNHLDLVDTPLAVSTRASSCNGREANISVVSLTLGTRL